MPTLSEVLDSGPKSSEQLTNELNPWSKSFAVMGTQERHTANRLVENRLAGAVLRHDCLM